MLDGQPLKKLVLLTTFLLTPASSAIGVRIRITAPLLGATRRAPKNFESAPGKTGID